MTNIQGPSYFRSNLIKKWDAPLPERPIFLADLVLELLEPHDVPCLIGIDSGLTVTKAVVFDRDGTVLAVARRRIPQVMPKPHHVERDMPLLWLAAASAIKEALERSGRKPGDVAAVAATAHGDGVFVLDGACQPLGPGILSLDSRAGDIVAQFESAGVAAQALALTGQKPLAPAPSALLAWIKQHELERFSRIGHVLSCKDWLRFCLCGILGTDRTESSTSFTNVKTQLYSDDALAIYGLSSLKAALPEVASSAQIVGHVTPAAARLTGLVEGTPVAAGLHDVTASALGIGGHKPGVAAVVAGTFSINEVVSATPQVSEHWLCRNAIAPGFWNSMAISPASSANYEWFLENLCAAESRAADASGHTIHEVLDAELQAALGKPSSLMFHPYLFGSPFGPDASAGFLGLRAWHDRGSVLRSIFEGVIFNHRLHLEKLKAAFVFDEVFLTGGTSRNPAFAQMFADVTAMPVRCSETPEAAAWGAALCAGAAVGLYESPDSDPRDLSAIAIRFTPDPARVAAMNRRYDVFVETTKTMAQLWPKLEQLAFDESQNR